MSLPLPKPFPLQFQNPAVTFPPFNSAAALHFGPQIPTDPDPEPVQNVVTNSSAQISIELANKELWQKFDKVGNEMVVTKPGRKMFPKLELNLRGLDPKGQYGLVMYMEKIDNNRYKYQAGGWSPSGQDDNGPIQSNSVEHHEGWNSGEFWASQERITFERVKLTNKEGDRKSLISLCSMQKYQPIIILFQCIPNPTNLSMSSSIVYKFRPKECKFIAVTAYQSEALTNLKIEFNPFAKGFREGSSRKRGASDLSPTPVDEPKIGPAALLNSSLFSASLNSNSSTNISPSQSLNYCPPPKRPLILASEHFPTVFPSSFPSATAAAQFAAVAMLANQQQKQQQIYGQNQHQFGHQFGGWQWPSPIIIGQQPFVESGTAASLSTFYQNLWQQIWMANNQQQQRKKEEGNQQGQIVVNDDGIKK